MLLLLRIVLGAQDSARLGERAEEVFVGEHMLFEKSLHAGPKERHGRGQKNTTVALLAGDDNDEVDETPNSFPFLFV
jgi:hypothetical protein